MKKNTKNMSNFISKPFTKRTKKQMNNEVIRLYVFAIMWATEVLLLLKLGGNEVFLSAPGASLETSVYASPPKRRKQPERYVQLLLNWLENIE
ncbi:MAG: hypothetical protein LBK94_10845 [Prevotellaceae bacterium]|nr:hypothetical protein [Prevotellaceae bacterium]